MRRPDAVDQSHLLDVCYYFIFFHLTQPENLAAAYFYLIFCHLVKNDFRQLDTVAGLVLR